MKGIIYKLHSKDNTITEYYIGSTINLNNRIISHKTCCHNVNSNSYNKKVYKFIRENGNWNNWTFEILDEVDIETKQELQQNYEKEYILNLKPKLNVVGMGRTKKQWNEDNKEKIDIQKKQWNEKNIDKIKQYYLDNKERIALRHKQYRLDNKEQLALRDKKKNECECGGKYTRTNKLQHNKSKKHQKYISNQSL